MARVALPSPEEVAGPYLTQYEVYYKRLDPEGKNEIGAADAAGFLKLSKLSDEQLGKIWDYSDADGKGFLDRTGFFAACKFVALVQDMQDLNPCNLKNESPAPNFGAETAPGAPTAQLAKSPAPNISFLVKPEEKRKYDALFDQLKPEDGKLNGDIVRKVMLGSKLPMPTLGSVWDLSDVDRDGFLNRYEFTVAMHLVYRALQGDKIPEELPAELSPEKVPKSLSTAPDVVNGGMPKSTTSPAPAGAAAPPPGVEAVQAVPWVVNAGEKLRYQALFRQTDTDRDGFVSGVEIKNVFLQTGLPQNILAHIWNLCDMNQEGKLNPEQFALAMWLIQRKQAGKDPPAALTPDMVPPSMRAKAQEGNMGNIYNNPELEMIAKEIQAMLSEKLQIEKEVQDIEYNMSVKNTEAHNLQAEYDTLAATFKQLNNQKNVAQKKLDDLDTQKAGIEADSRQMDVKIGEQMFEIEKLRTQADEQEKTLVEQEEEVHGKKRELEKLKDEEKQLKKDIKDTEREILMLEEGLKIASVLDEETQEKLEMLLEAEKHMVESTNSFNNACEDCSNVPETFLEPLRLNLDDLPDYSRLDKPRKPPVPEAPSLASQQNAANAMNGNNFGISDPAVDANASWSQNDAFGNFDQSKNAAQDLSFSAFDPFGLPTPKKASSSSSAAQFDPFGMSAASKPSNGSPAKNWASFEPAFGGGFNDTNNDAFSSNPSGAQDSSSPPPLAPRPDSTEFADSSQSPTPALPPKNTAPPPRRPPPPKRPPPPGAGGSSGPGPSRPPPPKSGTTSPAADDPFGGGAGTGDGGGFADFSNFASFDNQAKKTSSDPFDSAFASPVHQATTTKSTSNAQLSWADHDSAFGGSSADPTPTHTSRYYSAPPEDEEANKTASRYYSTPPVEFSEDPFKNSNYRYGDPFELAGADPFKGQEDPFTAPVTSAFGGGAEAAAPDPFASSTTPQPSEIESSDPFSLTLKSSLRPPPVPPAPTDKKQDIPSDDPFGPPAATANNDPFAAFGSSSASKTQGGSDAFGPKDAFGASKDDWFATPQKPKVDGIAKARPTSSSKSSKSLATSWGNSDPFESVPPSSGKKKSGKKSSHLSDFLTGSPLRGGHDSSASSASTTTPAKEKEHKKKHKFNLKIPGTGKKASASPSPSAPEGAAAQQQQVKMAEEASKRCEAERLRRLQLQEEQDLAYAIALSKAEAASLKTSS